MKKTKKLLIGFILLWVIGFLIIWGITILKKLPMKKTASPGIATEAIPGIATESDASSGELNSRSSPASEAVVVRCYRTVLIDFKDDLPVMGTVRGALKIELKFEVNGVIESINFREGDVIYKGDLIASLRINCQSQLPYFQERVYLRGGSQ